MAIEKTAQKAANEPKRRRSLFNSLFTSSNNNNNKQDEPMKTEMTSGRTKNKRKSRRVSVAQVSETTSNGKESISCNVKDSDSYELDLNDRLNCERSLRAKSCDVVRVRPSRTRSSANSTTNHPSSPLPLSLSPTAVSIGEWHTNENYIPNVAVATSRVENTSNATKQPIDEMRRKSTKDSEAKEKRHSWLFKRRAKYKSPIMEQLFETYQKQLGTCDSPVLPSTISASLSSTSKSSSGDVTISSDDSLALFKSATRAEAATNSNESNILRASHSPASKHLPNVATGDGPFERDQRLNYWHRLAYRSSMPSSGTSSDLDEDCESDALVITCSDDTSCSSVELVWSRPSERANALPQTRPTSMTTIVTPYVRAQQLDDASTKIEILQQRLRKQLEQTSARDIGKTTASTTANPQDWISYSPLDVRNNCLQSPKSPPQNNNQYLGREASKRPSSGGDRPAKNADKPHLALPEAIGHRSASAMSDSSSADVAASFGQMQRHKPVEELSNLKQVSILELAKPLRARQSGKEHRGSYQQRVVSNKSKHLRQSSKQTACDENASSKSSQWVANPLFGRVVGAKKQSKVTRVTGELKQRVEPKVKSETNSVLNDDPEAVAKRAIEEEVMARMAAVEERNRADRVREEAELLASGVDLADGMCDLEEHQEDIDPVELDDAEDLSHNLETANLSKLDDEHRKVGAKKRWSIRRRVVQTPLERAQLKNAQLKNHIVNLKTNITSFKSQLGSKLSDTSRRASMMADQLITSLKENTKEQLFGMVRDEDDRYDTLANSFATPAQLRASLMQPSGTKCTQDAKSNTNNKCDIKDGINKNNNIINSSGSISGKNIVKPKDLLDNNNYLLLNAPTSKARQFSLIFKHQQQLNGHPVVTRQPISMNPSLNRTNDNRTVPVSLTPQPNRPINKASESSIDVSNQRATNTSQLDSTIGPTKDKVGHNSNQPNPSKSSPRKGPHRNTLTMGDLEVPVSVMGGVVSNNNQFRRARRRRRRRFERSADLRAKVFEAIHKEDFGEQRKGLQKSEVDPLSDCYESSDESHERDYIDLEFERLYSCDLSQLSRKKLKLRNRTLRYWRRFRCRRMGLEVAKVLRDSPETM